MIKKFSVLIPITALILAGCDQPDNNRRVTAQTNMANNIGQPLNCEPKLVDDQWVVPVECNQQQVNNYETDHYYHTTNNHVNTVAAAATGVAAGVVAKTAYDKYNANKKTATTNPSAPSVKPTSVATVPPAPATKTVDLSKQTYRPAQTKPSYTAPKPKPSFSSSSSSRKSSGGRRK